MKCIMILANRGLPLHVDTVQIYTYLHIQCRGDSTMTTYLPASFRSIYLSRSSQPVSDIGVASTDTYLPPSHTR